MFLSLSRLTLIMMTLIQISKCGILKVSNFVHYKLMYLKYWQKTVYIWTCGQRLSIPFFLQCVSTINIINLSKLKTYKIKKGLLCSPPLKTRIQHVSYYIFHSPTTKCIFVIFYSNKLILVNVSSKFPKTIFRNYDRLRDFCNLLNLLLGGTMLNASLKT